MLLNEAQTDGERLRALLPSMLADLNEGSRKREHVLAPSFVVMLIILCFVTAAVAGALILLLKLTHLRPPPHLAQLQADSVIESNLVNYVMRKA